MKTQVRQYTRVRMFPVDVLRAAELAERCAPQDSEPNGRKDLIELLCGIAAIDDAMRRQEVTLQAIRAVYHTGNEHLEDLARYVKRRICG